MVRTSQTIHRINLYIRVSIDGNNQVITLILKKYGNLPLLFGELCIILVTPDFYKYFMFIHIRASGNIISNYHGTFMHIFMHRYCPIYQKKISKSSFFIIHARKYVSKADTVLIHLQNFLTLISFMIQ